MGLTDVVHRKEKTEVENKKDFYVTPHCLTEAFVEGMVDLKIFSKSYFDMARVLDPCAGEGAIGDVLKKYFRNVTEYDLYSGYTFEKDFFTETGKYDLILMNPPYSNKNDFIKYALKASNLVCVVLPENVINYTKMNEEFFDKDFYIGKIKTYPKFFMTDSLDEMKFGGMSTYAVYVFTNDYDLRRKFSTFKFEVIKDVRRYISE